MKQKILFIDDEVQSLFLYGTALKLIYGDEYEVLELEPKDTIESMIHHLQSVDDVVSIVIDEKLQVGIGTNYKGSQLVEAIRAFDTKLPLYILTSEMGLIDAPFGSVEYVIDKSCICQEGYQKQCAKLMRRHIATFNDIQSDRSTRFDSLLRKSLDEQLSEDEEAEYSQLDFLRVKRIMSSEPIISNSELDKQERLILHIESELRRLRGE